jgi:hypothetical protein
MWSNGKYRFGKISHAILPNDDSKEGEKASEKENRGYKRSMQSHQNLNIDHIAGFQGLQNQNPWPQKFTKLANKPSSIVNLALLDDAIT